MAAVQQAPPLTPAYMPPGPATLLLAGQSTSSPPVPATGSLPAVLQHSPRGAPGAAGPAGCLALVPAPAFASQPSGSRHVSPCSALQAAQSLGRGSLSSLSPRSVASPCMSLAMTQSGGATAGQEQLRRPAAQQQHHYQQQQLVRAGLVPAAASSGNLMGGGRSPGAPLAARRPSLIQTGSSGSLRSPVCSPKTAFRSRRPSLDQELFLREIFQRCDRDGDGQINKREMILACRGSPETASFLGLPSIIHQEDGSRDLLEAKFQALDKDNDRLVTWEEFYAYYIAELNQHDDEDEGGGPSAAAPAAAGARSSQAPGSMAFPSGCSALPSPVSPASTAAASAVGSRARGGSFTFAPGREAPAGFASSRTAAATSSSTEVAWRGQRLEQEHLERQRQENKRKEQEQLELERLEREQQLEKEVRESEMLERRRLELEEQETQRLERERQDLQRLEAERRAREEQDKVWEQAWEAKHQAKELQEAKLKAAEEKAQSARVQAAEKLLQELSDNPFELIPRASELTSLAWNAEAGSNSPGVPGQGQAYPTTDSGNFDFAAVLRNLHKESARNLERLMYHVRSVQLSQLSGELTERSNSQSAVGSTATPLAAPVPRRKLEEQSPALSSQDWSAVMQHDVFIRPPLHQPQSQPRTCSGSVGGSTCSRAPSPPPVAAPDRAPKAPDWASNARTLPPAPSQGRAPMATEPGTKASLSGLLEGQLQSGTSAGSMPGSGRGAAARPAAEFAGKLHVGADSLAGRKARVPNWTNQDWSLTLPLGPTRLLVAVFDGHGEQGHEISSSVGALFAHFASNVGLIAEERIGTQSSRLPRALAQLFSLAQDGLRRGGLADWSGTTATVAVIDAEAGAVVSAHVGDSRMVISHGNKVLFETVDHDVDDEAERRVAAAGGEVRRMTVSGIDARRVFFPGFDTPGLAMSRALGDLQACSIGVLAEPTVNTCLELADGSAIIVATDGIWEKVSPQEAAAITSAALAIDQDGGGGAALAARALVAEARSRWQADGGDIDDITAVVVHMESSAR
eukprot:TRINITY_DN88594_c0_g1_i1.p1 TRINITY_DN88594_c0_g1~~TRINITY_DN88594_c0_g1_i1.p1  ORF type:complete len:1030 (-),score=206.19 TRINITY_DN88594_c0_g1_i1:109-3198(-)